MGSDDDDSAANEQDQQDPERADLRFPRWDDRVAATSSGENAQTPAAPVGGDEVGRRRPPRGGVHSSLLRHDLETSRSS